MPFTLAHPAAVWPLKYVRHLAVIPLIIGSLTPDLAGYLPDARELVNSHSVRGTFFVDLPLGYALLLLLMLLHTLLLEPLWNPHRSFISSACKEYLANRWWWLLAIPSLLFGSWTHILWDSFTHENRFMVRRLPMLQEMVAIDSDHTLHLYRILQYGCSVLGVIAIAWWYHHELRSTTIPQSNSVTRKRVLLSLIVISLLAGLVNAVFIAELHQVYWFISTILTTAMPVFAVLYGVTACVFRLRSPIND